MLTPLPPPKNFLNSEPKSQVTTPDDMSIAERFLDEAAEAAAKVAAAA